MATPTAEDATHAGRCRVSPRRVAAAARSKRPIAIAWDRYVSRCGKGGDSSSARRVVVARFHLEDEPTTMSNVVTLFFVSLWRGATVMRDALWIPSRGRADDDVDCSRSFAAKGGDPSMRHAVLLSLSSITHTSKRPIAGRRRPRGAAAGGGAAAR